MQDLFFLQMTSAQAETQKDGSPNLYCHYKIQSISGSPIELWLRGFHYFVHPPTYSQSLPTHAEKNPICEYSWALLLLLY